MHGSFPALAQIHVDGSNNIYTGSNLFMSGYANLRTLIFGFDHSRVRKFAYPAIRLFISGYANLRILLIAAYGVGKFAYHLICLFN